MFRKTIGQYLFYAATHMQQRRIVLSLGLKDPPTSAANASRFTSRKLEVHSQLGYLFDLVPLLFGLIRSKPSRGYRDQKGATGGVIEKKVYHTTSAPPPDATFSAYVTRHCRLIL
jgi:hypothetical protein